MKKYLKLLGLLLVLSLFIMGQAGCPGCRDTTKPNVAITSPTNNSTVSGTVTIQATATDNVEVVKVEFYIDGQKVGEDTSSPYEYSWNTDNLQYNSTHTIQAKAYDNAGNVGESPIITVTIGDSNAPEVTITNPRNGDTVSGTVTIQAQVTERSIKTKAPSGIAKVEFYIDGNKVGEDTSSPYEYNWDTSGLTTSSTHTIQAKAYDNAGNIGESSLITVTNIVLPPTTKILDEPTIQSLSSVSSDGSTLIFSQSTPLLQSLSPGNIIIVGITPNTPYGLLRKVTLIRKVRGNIIVETEPASLEEAIQDGIFRANITLTPDDVISVDTLKKGIRAQSKTPRAFNVSMDNVILYDEDGNEATTNDQIRASGSISFEPVFSFDVEIGGFRIRHLTSEITMTNTSSLKTISEVSKSIEKKIPIAVYYFTPIPISTLPPIVITPEITLNVGASGEVSLGITTDVTQTAELTAGLSYSSGNWSIIKDFHSDFQFVPPLLSAGANFRGFIGVELSSLVNGIAGPYGEVSGYLELNADPLSNPWWKLYGGLLADMGVKMEIFSHTIANYYCNIIDYSQLLAQAGGPATGTIQGTVKDTNNQPIQGATVSVEGTSLQATTNSQGYYQITDVPAGNKTVTASKSGYNSQSKTVTVVAGQTTTVDFSLTPVPTTGTIQGTVKDTNNQPIQGATVSVEGTSLQATTNSQGYYQITDIPAGNKTVTASKSGYNSQSKTVNVVAGQTTTVDFSLTPVPTTGTIQGNVKDTNNQPIQGATVSVEGTSLQATTNSQGYYQITDVPAGIRQLQPLNQVTIVRVRQ
jgi:protocatechuate 3,4-dioxygenase beta subunit